MRAGLAAAFSLLFLWSAPLCAQPSETAEVSRQLTEAGRWFEKLAEALNTDAEGFQALNQGMQALATPGLTRERAAAAAPGLRKLLERSRADLRRSGALLDAMPPFPLGISIEMSPKQLLEDGRAQNGRMFAMLEAFDSFLVGMEKSDIAAMERALPRMREGGYALVGQQRLLIRARQASVPASESVHQSLGIAGQIYRAMEAVVRSTAVKGGTEAAAAAAAATLREELRLVGEETRALAAAGRRNMARELAEIEAASGNPEEARLAERVRRLYAAEGKVFLLSDRLVALTESSQGVTGAQLRALTRSPFLAPLAQLEADYIAATREQAEALADGPE